ncbi:leucyl aminopeptidase [Paenarthrobacter sp. Z7-10]|uniref:leucyl aminopeptidase n=1 Tax=Paenarthrobacter sp. Z7-10 TaxID=2787635 RepID=UPI0022A9F409|nr:leucyl aminopeptidase [Paenarthrobacter sp. Z7-10]MCZ2402394.1 leucyl aminopeptidase [Paenarthrobacter sp. Z7-10]
MFTNDEVTLKAVAKDLKKHRSDALVIGVGQGVEGPVLLDSPLPSKAANALAASLAELGITGAADEVRRFPGIEELGAAVLVLAGVGKVADGQVSAEALRRAAGSAIRQLAGVGSVVVALPTTTIAEAAAVAEGAALGAYSYTEHRTAGPSGHKPNVRAVTVFTPLATDRAMAPALERATVLARAVNATRTLVNAPPSHLYPETFADAAKELAAGLPVKVTVSDEKALKKAGFGGILGVGQGSSRPPRLIKVEYSPARAKAHLAFVGKGITFDSGGISLKPAAGMMTMKCDMAGAAVILNALLAVARLGLPMKLTAWLCVAENLPSATAIRPSDVLTMFGGKTVEVLNTDAEGRLVMADGLAAASAEMPDAILDVATLTGAQVVALGHRVSAVMGDEGVTAAVQAAAKRAGELFWPMPLPEELRPSLDSPVADLANIGEKAGGMMTAAVFLNEFVGNGPDGAKIPWAHLDIAGPAFNEGSAYGYTPKQGTGTGVRTLVAYVEDVLQRTA